MKEALFYEKLDNKKVRCKLCNHFCQILPGKRGICGVRENEDGKLYSLVYGKIISEAIDPIEKKPLFHFLPGTTSLSIATIGCNFRCKNCQNADISQASKEGYFFDKKEIPGENIHPEKIIDDAIKNNCQSISYTYTEPTVFFEYAYETMKLAHKEGLKNVFVSNGYMSKEVLEKCKGLLDAINIDLKFWSNDLYLEICGAKVKPVLENLKLIKKLGIWLEITTLVIPTLTDKKGELENIAKFVANELGEETPWHVSAFYPTYKLTDIPPTTTEEIHRAYEIGKSAGLKYVYSGNISGDKGEDTFCPKCDALMINRTGYIIERFDDNGECKKCGENLSLME